MDSDYDLWRKGDYNVLLEKYEPLIKKESYFQYSSFHPDCSESYEDFIQTNMLVGYNTIGYLKKRIAEGTTRLYEKFYFGFYLKQRMKSYFNLSKRTQKDRINHNLYHYSDFIDNEEINYDCFSDKKSHSCIIEFNCCFNEFISNLSKEEIEFFRILQIHKYRNKITKKLKITNTHFDRLKYALKEKYIKYCIDEENYEKLQ